ncbi:MAG: hypothetical protein D6679_06690 [Candidatus Hydrogenedentota bacterium]|nr:MAG: hypothetical protein D6679_06690 [Candidatus Hydrogenedentota bacterium]
MIEKREDIQRDLEPSVDGNRVTFHFDAPEARMVNVLGTFNHWELTEGVMRKNEDGIWTRTVEVPLAGCYDYKFLADGQWLLDPRNPDYGRDAKGRYNSRFQIHTSERARALLADVDRRLEANPPGADPGTRREIFEDLDGILQLPNAPWSYTLNRHFLRRIRKYGDRVERETAASVANIYCHGFVLERGLRIGIDVVATRAVWGVYWDIPDDVYLRLASALDLLCISHLHPDHFDYHLASAMVAQGKTVLVPYEIRERFPSGAVGIRDGEPFEKEGTRVTFRKGIHVYDERERLVLKIIDIVSGDGFHTVHLSDHDYTRGVDVEPPVDLLLAKTGGISPLVPSFPAFRNLLLHLEPKRFVTGHLNELGHPVRAGREPYRTGWEIVRENSNYEGMVLHWCEEWRL